MIPLIYFLLAWVVFLGIFAVMSLLTMMQMLRFGLAGLGTYATTFIFLAVSVAVVLGSAFYFTGVDWNQSADIFGGLVSSPIFNPTAL
ncbi:hypothetical protein HZC53_04230 [Candidatus Uhrbacteria bacterium]|nr:hypothetical protein [Candidatus Uhrbacteria bacterium]